MITTVNKGDIIPFGSFMWRVLEVRDNKALLITENIISKVCDIMNKFGYKDYLRQTWKWSYLREYLNIEFLNNFSQSEKDFIVEIDIEPPSSDKIFLLDDEEANKYFEDDR